MITLLIRTLLIYFILVFAIRLMGKRQIGELQVSEFIISIILSEIAATPIMNRSMPFLYAVLPILLLLSVEVILSFVLLKSNRLKRIFYGSPSVIIRKGTLVQKELRRNRMELDELMSSLRQKGFSDLADVEYAILEENGQLSVFPKADRAPATPKNLSLTVRECGIAHVCVIDGQIITENLRLTSWNKSRLLAEIEARHATLSDVFLMTVDDGESVTLIKKEDAVLSPYKKGRKK